MSPKEESELRDRYRSWPLEQLARAATQERHQYRPEAIFLIEEELRRRDITVPEAGEIAAATPPRPVSSGEQAMSSTGRYFRKRIVGVCLFMGMLLGYVVAELGTRELTHDETYYRTHYLPRLVGAVLAFLFSSAVLKMAIAFLRWSDTGDPLAPPGTVAPPKSEDELVGGLRYWPLVLPWVGLVISFSFE